MSGFDLWKLLFKRSLRLFWVCAVFALLFAVVFFVGFVRDDMLSGLYEDIIGDTGSEYLVMQCEYSPALSAGDAEVGVYYSASGETYDVTLSFGEAEVFVDRYSRGLHICKVLPVWQNYIAGEEIAKKEDAIWLFRTYATLYNLSVGDSVTVSAGDYVGSFRVAGTYSGDLVRYLQSGFTPSFLIAYGEAETSASLVCTVDQVYSLYKSELGKTVTGDDGVMNLCAGYSVAEIGFHVLFCLFAVVAVLLQIKMIHFMRQRTAVCFRMYGE